MGYEFNFGAMGSLPPARAGKGSEVFRLAILGDFSARANRGEIAVGEALAARKPLRVDVDNLEDVLQRLRVKLNLDIGGDEGTIEVELNTLDSFQPDELYDNLEIFSQLAGLRQRLQNRSTFAKAAQEMQSWKGLALPDETAGGRPKPRGSVLATDCKLSDFARLIERTEQEERPEISIDALLRQVVAPHVVPAKDPKQDVLVAAVDAAISDMMRRVLHHPDFQATEGLWRSIDFLVRRLETGVNLKLVLYDLTAEELAADLSAASNLQDTGLYQLLVEQPALDAQQGPVSAIVGNYLFEQTPPHAELLGRMAKIAAAAQAPFIASIGTECLKKVDPEDVSALITDSWAALKALPEACYLALTVPRFLLRNPYGQRTDPIDRFEFEEFTPQYGVRGMLWGQSSILAGLLLGLTFTKQGFKKMSLGSILGVGDMPFYYYTDADGDQVALPCTERLISSSTADYVGSQRFVPVLSIRGRPEVRLGGFQSLAGKPLAGPWAPVTITPSGEVMAAPAAKPAPPPAEAAAPAPAPAPETPAPAEAGAEADLDALLAALSTPEEKPAEEGDGGLDPDLAALLGDL